MSVERHPPRLRMPSLGSRSLHSIATQSPERPDGCRRSRLPAKSPYKPVFISIRSVGRYKRRCAARNVRKCRGVKPDARKISRTGQPSGRRCLRISNAFSNFTQQVPKAFCTSDRFARTGARDALLLAKHYQQSFGQNPIRKGFSSGRQPKTAIKRHRGRSSSPIQVMALRSKGRGKRSARGEIAGSVL